MSSSVSPVARPDVFFSYHWSDHVVVEAVARSLQARGLTVFLDRWYLPAGQPWPQTLETTLQQCRSVAVFLGPTGLGSWQQREQYVALTRQDRQRGFPVIPILLPGADPPLGFLGLGTWVDLRGGFPDEGALAVLEAGIRGQAPGLEAQGRIDEARAGLCPYRGLHPFREEDAGFFCGREAVTQRLIETVARTSFVAVVGSSGSGKSSVVRAGLIPALRGAQNGTVWDVVSLVPTDRPLHSLAAAMVPLIDPGLSAVDSLAESSKLAAHLSGGQVSLRDVIARSLVGQPGTDRLLLFVDQWEELYTLCQDHQARERFLIAMLQAADSGRAAVVLTMRGDFFGQALSHRAFADRLQGAQINIGPMTPEELRRSITSPLDAVNLQFEPGLVDLILREAGSEPGNLPLLEFVLAELWQKRRGGILHHEAYDRIGGIRAAIAARADREFAQLDDAQKLAARRVLVQMVRPGEGTHDTRRRAPLPRADLVALAALRRLADARLVVTGRDTSTGEETVEVAHEALIQNWAHLRQWLDEDREFLRTSSRIDAAAALWETEGRETTRLLPEGRALAEGQELLSQRRADLPRRSIDFVETSATWAKRRRRSLLRLAAAVFVGVLGLAAGAFWQWQRARALGDQARRIAAEGDFELATRLLDRGNEETPRAIAHLTRSIETWPSDRRAAHRLISVFRDRTWWRKLEGGSKFGFGVTAQLSPGGKLALTAAGDVVAIWETETGERVGQPLKVPGWVSMVRFAPNGQRVVSVHGDAAQVWEPATGRQVGAPLKHAQDVVSAVLSTDGRLLLTSSYESTAFLWEVDTGKVLRRLGDGLYPILWASFSADGGRVVTVSTEHAAQVWERETGKTLGGPLQHGDRLSWAGFSPDGKRVLTAGDQLVRVWEAASGRQLGQPLRHTSRVLSASFSPDGGRIVTTSLDSRAQEWDAETGEPIGPPIRNAVVTAYTPDGRSLVTAAGDATALWAAAVSSRVWEPLGEGGFVAKVSFSDGARRVLASERGQPRVWDVETGLPVGGPIKLRAPAELSLSADGRWLLLEFQDRSTEVWETETGKSVGAALRHVPPMGENSLSRDGRRVLALSDERTLRMWRVETREPVGEPMTHATPVDRASFTPDDRRILTSAGNEVQIWDAETGKAIGGPVRADGIIVGMRVSADGRRFLTVVSSRFRDAQIWNVETGRSVAKLRGYESPVSGARFSADGNRVVTISANEAQVWEVETGTRIGVALKHDGPVTDARFSLDGGRVVTASVDTSVRVWDVETGKPLGEPLSHDDGVSMATFTPDGDRVVSVSWSSTRVWLQPKVQDTPPRWFLRWAEGMGGQRFDERGVVVSAPIPEIPADGSGTFGRLARWFVQTGAERTVTPLSTRTIRDWVGERVGIGTRAALRDANRALPGDPLVQAAMAGLGAPDSDPVFAEARATYACEHAELNAGAENGQPVRSRQAAVHFRAAQALAKIASRGDQSLLARARSAAEMAARLDPSRPEYAELPAGLAQTAHGLAPPADAIERRRDRGRGRGRR